MDTYSLGIPRHVKVSRTILVIDHSIVGSRCLLYVLLDSFPFQSPSNRILRHSNEDAELYPVLLRSRRMNWYRLVIPLKSIDDEGKPHL